MPEVAGDNIQTVNMDHHGLIAALCSDLKVAERIDTGLKNHPQRKVSAGQAVIAIRMYGLIRKTCLEV